MLTQLQSVEVVPGCTACAIDSSSLFDSTVYALPERRKGGEERRGEERREGAYFSNRKEKEEGRKEGRGVAGLGPATARQR